MRRTLLGQCRDCKYRTMFTYCSKRNCKKCKLLTNPTPIGYDEEGEVEQTREVTCLCLCDATDEELRTKTCKYKEVVNNA